MALNFSSPETKKYIKQFSQRIFIVDNVPYKATKSAEVIIDISKQQIDKKIELYKHLKGVKSTQLTILSKRIERLENSISDSNKDIIYSIFTSNTQDLQNSSTIEIASIHSIMNLSGLKIFQTIYELRINRMRLVNQIANLTMLIEKLEQSKGDLDAYKSALQSV
jgi:ribosomal protein S15P/S13E